MQQHVTVGMEQLVTALNEHVSNLPLLTGNLPSVSTEHVNMPVGWHSVQQTPHSKCGSVQLEERRLARECLTCNDLEAALLHLERAKAIVEYVRGEGKSEQAEIDTNRTAVLLELAAVFTAMGRHSPASAKCSEALALDGRSVQALLGRAKANLALHNYQASLQLSLPRPI